MTKIPDTANAEAILKAARCASQAHLRTFNAAASCVESLRTVVLSLPFEHPLRLKAARLVKGMQEVVRTLDGFSTPDGVNTFQEVTTLLIEVEAATEHHASAFDACI